MDCSRARDSLGPYVDGELAGPDAEALQDHLRACRECARELQRLEDLLHQLAAAKPPEPSAPADVWLHIEGRLRHPRRSHRHRSRRRHHRASSHRRRSITQVLRRPLAAAASLALLIGVSVVFIGPWINDSAQTAEAGVVDYSLLLDGVAADVDAAVDRFLRHYRADSIAAELLPAVAPNLDFRAPPELPGGFRREGLYRLKFGAAEGVAARYRRAKEPLVVFFHPPMEHTQMGLHRESTCHVAGREGQRVEAGPWKLVHFTDLTTCHCLLSRISDEGEQSMIFAAVAPGFHRPAEE